MSKRKSFHYGKLEQYLRNYAQKATLDFHKYSEYHMRLMDGGFTALDVWTTGKYYVLESNYYKMFPDIKIVERGGEKGTIDGNNQKAVEKFLQKMFFPIDAE